jgi:lipopolysaccharide transport system permease protein
MSTIHAEPPKVVLTPARDPLLGTLLSTRPWISPWRARRLVRHLAARRLQERFRGSVLGACWVFLLPLLMLAVYAFAFVVVLGIGGADADRSTKVELTFSIFCGLIVFGVFNETAQRSASAVVSQPQFVKKVVFPLDALPVVALAESVVLASASLAVLLVGVMLGLGRIHATWLLLPLPLALLAMLALGVGWVLAAVGVFVRDLPQVLGVVMQMLFFLTPICYRLQDVPPWARSIVAINPLVPIIESTRGIVLHGQAPQIAQLAWVALAGVVAIHAGHALFTSLHRRFADVL